MDKMNNLPTYALSIRQPWAWAIMERGKNIENRSWLTKFRGPVCIHAAKKVTDADVFAMHQTMARIRKQLRVHPRHITVPPKTHFIRGAMIGTAVITDCVTASNSPWFEAGGFGFVLEDVEEIDPFPCNGALGFFDWRKYVIENKGPSESNDLI